MVDEAAEASAVFVVEGAEDDEDVAGIGAGTGGDGSRTCWAGSMHGGGSVSKCSQLGPCPLVAAVVIPQRSRRPLA